MEFLKTFIKKYWKKIIVGLIFFITSKLILGLFKRSKEES